MNGLKTIIVRKFECWRQIVDRALANRQLAVLISAWSIISSGLSCSMLTHEMFRGDAPFWIFYLALLIGMAIGAICWGIGVGATPIAILLLERSGNVSIIISANKQPIWLVVGMGAIILAEIVLITIVRLNRRQALIGMPDHAWRYRPSSRILSHFTRTALIVVAVVAAFVGSILLLPAGGDKVAPAVTVIGWALAFFLVSLRYSQYIHAREIPQGGTH